MGVHGWYTKLLSPDFHRTLRLGRLQARQRLGNGLGGQAFALQFLADARQSQFGGTAVNDGVDHPLLIDEAFGLQFIQRLDERAGLFFEAFQLVLQLQPGVLAPAQEPQRAAFEGGFGKRHAALRPEVNGSMAVYWPKMLLVL